MTENGERLMDLLVQPAFCHLPVGKTDKQIVYPRLVPSNLAQDDTEARAWNLFLYDIWNRTGYVNSVGYPSGIRC